MDQEEQTEQRSDVFEFTTTNKIEFSNVNSGDFDETFTVYMVAPSYREKVHALKLQQQIYRAFGKASDNRKENQSQGAKEADGADETEGEDEEMNGHRVMILLSMFGDLQAVDTVFEALAPKVSELGTGIPFLPKHYRQLSLPDQRRMCGEYIANFIMPLVISEMKQAF